MTGGSDSQSLSREEALQLLAFEIAVGVMFIFAWPLIALWDLVRPHFPRRAP